MYDLQFPQPSSLRLHGSILMVLAAAEILIGTPSSLFIQPCSGPPLISFIPPEQVFFRSRGYAQLGPPLPLLGHLYVPGTLKCPDPIT